MNPNQSNEQPGLSLPTPSFEAQPGEAEQPIKTPEKGVGLERPMRSASTTASSSQAQIPTDDNQAPIMRQGNLADDHSLSTPAKADDTDLIEKEWVMKAKQIVDKNKEDPYRQTNEINRFKADYVKKRYNKDIKVTDG